MPTDRKILAQMVRHIQHAPEDPFTPLVDEYLIRRLNRKAERAEVTVDLRPRYRPGKRLSPSSIGGCQRAAVFQFAGIRGTKRVNPDVELIWENGDWVHRKWQAIFQDMELVLGKKRVKVLGIEEHVRYPELYIAGALDIAVRIKLPDGRKVKIVIDVKSINERGWKRLLETSEPIESHVRQVTTYGVARGDIDMLCLLYENKNTNQVMFFLFEIDMKVWHVVEDWCEEVLQKLRDQELPAMDASCDHGNFAYDKCPHKGICYGSWNKVRIRKHTFKNFRGVDELWKEGLQEEIDG